MTTQRPTMKCPNCGAEMNMHAQKVDYTAALKDLEAVDPVLGGVVEEFHTCPKCGGSASRRAS